MLCLKHDSLIGELAEPAASAPSDAGRSLQTWMHHLFQIVKWHLQAGT
jgi:hypothetical protein